MAMNGPDNVSNTQMLEYEEKWLVFFLFCFFLYLPLELTLELHPFEIPLEILSISAASRSCSIHLWLLA